MTDIEKIDRAVFSYLTTISSKVIWSPTQLALRTITKREKFEDQKPWNFISYYRAPSFEVDWSRMNNPATISGSLNRLVENSMDRGVDARYIQNIPLNLTYYVDIWASKSVEVQELAISLISKMYMQDQVLEVPLLPEGDLVRFHLLDITWDDNSDIERENEIGRIYRHTISFTVDARLTLVREIKTTRFCCVPVNIYDEYEGVLNDVN